MPPDEFRDLPPNEQFLRLFGYLEQWRKAFEENVQQHLSEIYKSLGALHTGSSVPSSYGSGLPYTKHKRPCGCGHCRGYNHCRVPVTWIPIPWINPCWWMMCCQPICPDTPCRGYEPHTPPPYDQTEEGPETPPPVNVR